MPFLSCHFHSNTKYSALILYAVGGLMVNSMKTTFCTAKYFRNTFSLPYVK